MKQGVFSESVSPLLSGSLLAIPAGVPPPGYLEGILISSFPLSIIMTHDVRRPEVRYEISPVVDSDTLVVTRMFVLCCSRFIAAEK
jgi:hypothetical protein